MRSFVFKAAETMDTLTPKCQIKRANTATLYLKLMRSTKQILIHMTRLIFGILLIAKTGLCATGTNEHGSTSATVRGILAHEGFELKYFAGT